jgi:hypothetical protein
MAGTYLLNVFCQSTKSPTSSLKEQRLIIVSGLSVMDKGVSAVPAVKISHDEMD